MTELAPCGHPIYGENDHCAEMTCPNYINKCINHNIALEEGWSDD